MNQAILIGNLGADPEVTEITGGRKVAKFSVATTERWRDAQGERQERTTWHRIVAWEGLATIASKYLAKGRQVCVVGRIQNRSYENSEGQTVYVSEILADKIELLGRAPEQEAPPARPARAAAKKPVAAKAPAKAPAGRGGNRKGAQPVQAEMPMDDGISDDEVPF